MLIRYRLAFAGLFLAGFAAAQISQGGRPFALRTENTGLFSTIDVPTVLLPRLDVARARAEDGNDPLMQRVAAPLPTDISWGQGVWTDLPNGDRLWRCAVQSDGASGLVLLFDQLQLPEGAELFAFTPDGTHVRGAYTAESCTPSGKFTIGMLPGSTVMLEYREPAAVRDLGRLHLNRVDYAYRQESKTSKESTGFGASLSCNVNVNCPEGANWQTEKKGIARILMVFPEGSAYCTGSLVANTANDAEPYFLTAHHCQLLRENPVFDQWVFDFDFEGSGCTNPTTAPVRRSMLGCQRMAFRDETDFLLLKLNPLPPNYGVYFNGWSRSTTPPANTTFMHHPVGDIKKISHDRDQTILHPQTIDWGTAFGFSPANTHWRIVPDVGVFQSGSSGAPLFDPEKRLIGQLHGGNADKNNQCLIFNAYFGQFSLSWNQGASSQTRLRDWLDRGNTNAMTQNGYPQPAVTAFNIAGRVQTYWGVNMPGVTVKLTGGPVALEAVTDSTGRYRFDNVPAAQNYTLAPQHNRNPVNGVTSFDLARISKHILGAEALNSPWKILAADANGSNSVTSFDIVECRKIILGAETSFSSLPSWRFFPASTTFADKANPFTAPMPTEGGTIVNLQQNISNANFYGVKVGDTNETAEANQ